MDDENGLDVYRVTDIEGEVYYIATFDIHNMIDAFYIENPDSAIIEIALITQQLFMIKKEHQIQT